MMTSGMHRRPFEGQHLVHPFNLTLNLETFNSFARNYDDMCRRVDYQFDYLILQCVNSFFLLILRYNLR